MVEFGTTQQRLRTEMPECIFCAIINGKQPSRKVYEDNAVTAFLDIRPANPGHTLIVPKEHHQIIQAMPDNTIQSLARAARLISHATLRAFKAQGTTIFIASGNAAGQAVPHAHIHLIPRFPGDGIPGLPGKEISEEQLESIRKEIAAKSIIEESPIKEPSAGCILCDVGAAKVKAKKVYESESALAVLAHKPVVPGHAIIFPKMHKTIIEQLSSNQFANFFVEVVHLAMLIFEVLNAEGTNIIIQNGEAAGQEIPHVCAHIIPRFSNDGVNLMWQPKQLNEEQMDTIHKMMLEAVKSLEKKEGEAAEKAEQAPPNEEPEEKEFLLSKLRRIP